MNTLNGGWIQTFSGKKFYPMAPDPDAITLLDIAQSLARRHRFACHSELPISVAQHSCVVALVCPREHRIHGLLHDAAEAYLGDVVSPLKSVLPEPLRGTIREMEERVLSAIYTKLEIPPPSPSAIEAVHVADMRALVTEVRDFLGVKHPDFSLPNVSPIGLARSVVPKSWDEEFARFKFLNFFSTIQGNRELFVEYLQP